MSDLKEYLKQTKTVLVTQDAFDELMQRAYAQPEIIRCKDCKHYNAGFECLIEGYGIEYDEDYFCGSAERRTDEPDR